MITVLLATYNGEKYLSEQLDSLLGQSFKDIKILARDDASTDGTVAILEDYAKKHPETITVIKGEGTGSACANFLELIRLADDDYVQKEFLRFQSVVFPYCQMSQTRNSPDVTHRAFYS